MIVPENSPTRRMPVTLDHRSILYLDGIRYSTQLVDLAYSRLEGTLEKLLHKDDKQGAVGNLIVEAISDAWAFVDSLHRLRGLVQQLPGLKQNQPQLQIFLRKSKQAEDFRHYIQHLRNNIDDHVRTKMPLWGTISWTWTNPETGLAENHMIIPGTYFSDCRVVGCTFDTHAGHFIENLVLHVGPIRVDLAGLHSRVAQFWEWFEGHIKPTFDADKRHGSDVHVTLWIKPIEGAVATEQ